MRCTEIIEESRERFTAAKLGQRLLTGVVQIAKRKGLAAYDLVV